MPVPIESSNLSALRTHVLDLLGGGNAHLDFDAALKGLTPEHRGAKAAGSPHTIWQLLEHLRIAQQDILGFSRNPQHPPLKWPGEYWPNSAAPPGEHAWIASMESFRRDQAEFAALLSDPQHDLLSPLPHAPEGQTLLREALVLADHNSYHLGQIILLRKILESGEAQ